MGAGEPAQTPITQAQANVIRLRLLWCFADYLKEIRIAAGKPSYRALLRFGPNLAKSTISDVLRGASAPRYEFVRDYLRACRAYARANGRPVDIPIFDGPALFEAWSQLQFALDKVQLLTRDAIAELVGEEVSDWPPADWRRQVREAASSSADVDLSLLMQVRDGLQRSRPA